MKRNSTRLKNLFQFFLVVILAASFAEISLTGCKPKKIPMAMPTPVPTSVPALGFIVFVQSGHLAKFDLSNSQITPLTSGKTTEFYPVCSPKDSQVVYWSNADTEIYNLWKIDLSTSQRTQLTFNEKDGLSPAEQNLLINSSAAWSSDGKSIIYAQDGDIWALDSDGYNPRTILSGHGALCPSFSPDGKSVLYLSNLGDTAYNLYILNQSDKSIKQITHYTDWNVGSPNYSADGSKILYNLYRGDITQIYSAKADGSEAFSLNTNTHSLSPRFGQNDKKIYYASYGSDDDSTLNIYVMNSNGTDIKALTANGGSSPSWAAGLKTPPAAANFK